MVDATFNSYRYHEKQRERIQAVREKIAGREIVSSDGRVIPEEGDLPIGVGRRLTAAVMFIDICGFSSRPSSAEKDQKSSE